MACDVCGAKASEKCEPGCFNEPGREGIRRFSGVEREPEYVSAILEGEGNSRAMHLRFDVTDGGQPLSVSISPDGMEVALTVTGGMIEIPNVVRQLHKVTTQLLCRKKGTNGQR